MIFRGRLSFPAPFCKAGFPEHESTCLYWLLQCPRRCPAEVFFQAKAARLKNDGRTPVQTGSK
ncbi:MAG: hypothetical protein CMJ81_10220 [Planctomycetaceae bacterium]|nr:hypothetical protein [Planctomycetaceae bacterium]MBP60999.1 hypothetical protein [Planctomycetaceae bacterium]